MQPERVASGNQALGNNPLLSTILTTAPDSCVRTTIRTIIIMGVVLIVGIWAVVAVSINTARETAMAHTRAETKNLATAFADEVTHILDGVAADMEVVAERMHAGRNLKGIFRDISLQQVATIQGAVLAPDGMLAATTLDPNPEPLDLSDREHFRVHLDGRFKGIFIGKPVTGRLSKQITIQVSRRVDGEDGRFLGVILFALSPAQLTTLQKSIDLGPNGVVTLAGIDNIIRARFTREHPDGLAGVGQSIAGDPRPSTIPENGYGDYIRDSPIDHVTRLLSYRRLTDYPLVVIVGLDLNQALASWRWYAAMIIAMSFGATLLLTGLAGYLIRQIFRDARVARETTLAITHSAEHDFLTGLSNRMLLNDRISKAIALAQRHNKKVAVLFLDLDGFKHINDSLGHQVGDKLLQSVAKRLVACIRGSDAVSRQGGDEFVALLAEVQRSEDAAVMARRILQAVGEPHSIDRHDLHITTSIGVSVYPDDGLDAETLIKNADTAMYQAKENGRHGYQFFTPAMNVRAVERQAIEEGLRRALERHEFSLRYQPKINLKTGTITGAEALILWTHPTRGLVSPSEFIPIAEDCGLILPISAWVLRTACDQARAWLDAGLPATTMAVNVSAMEFRDENFLENLFAILIETGLDPRSLELELTETLLMKHAESAASILQTLRRRGVQVAIDDFGTGYSSLGYLRKFPLDALKIDQSFVRRISIAAGDAPIVTAVIAMAHSLKLRVVAEGVETLEELEFLKAHECDEAQGYYFSRPVPPEQFARLLRSGIAEPSVLAHRSLVPL
jgi:diguanylate cyclase (GGDEF)-like protein